MKKSVSSREEEMYLPQELLSEILSWLDVDSLLRFKTVCKKWRSLIEDRTFIYSHLMKSRVQWVFKTAKNNNSNYNRYECLFSQHGILVEYNNKKKIYRLRNPSTEKILELPDAGKHIMLQEIDMCLLIHSSHKLKLVVPCQYEKGKLVCKVFTVGIDVAWRDIEIPFSIDANVMVRETMIVSEVYFMLCLTDDGIEVLCLGMDSEQISRIKVPKSLFPNQLDVELLFRRSRPALGSVVEDEVHIWLLESDRNNIRWAEKKIIVPLKFVDHRSKGRMHLRRISNEGLLLNYDSKEEFLLDVSSGKIKWHNCPPQGQEFAYYYAPSLLHPK